MMCDDKLSIAPTSEFVNLALKDVDSLATLDCDIHLKYDVNEIMAMLKTPVKMDTIMTPDSRLVLVEGPPGIGKSTLCWELCRKWDTMKSLQCFKIVLQLKLREARVQNATSLHEIFYHDDKRLCDSVVEEAYGCEGEGILMIFDGFDEMPAQDESSLIMKLTSGKCLPRATRLITSRPSALHYKKLFRQKHVRVEILGFTDENKLAFAQSAFKSQPHLLSHFKT